ncbi:MAG: Fic family protein [Bacteroidetes bacterium]|nr:Fic family protein [Bacteroidota bacterium]
MKPMKKADEDRLWTKIRLNWNYNSNHLEGNTLTYSQTELLLIFDKATGEHEMREYEEMKAHDVALHLVRNIASDQEHPLTESFIKELNRVILVKPFWKEAITPDGQPTRKLIKVGDYKDTPNSVRLQNGEIFHYSSPDEVRPMMQELMVFYKKHSISTVSHPLWLAAMFHYQFVRVHPFDDGNGRIARLIMNYILMRKDYAPVIIPSSDKKNYLLALNKADTGDMESFVIYIGEHLVRSLEMSIKAARGESIEEPTDPDKEIELFKRSLADREVVKVKKNRKVIQELYSHSLSGLFTTIHQKLEQFNDLFNETDHTYWVEHSIQTTLLKPPGRNLKFIEDQLLFDFNNPQKFGQVLNEIYIQGIPQKPLQYPDIRQIRIDFYWRGFKKAGTNTFDVQTSVYVDFQEYKYRIYCNFVPPNPIQKTYNHYMSETEYHAFSAELTRNTLGMIKNSCGIKE